MPESKSTTVDQSTTEAQDTTPAASTRAVALIDEGNRLEEQGRISEAMAQYDAAVQADPRCARAHLNRGNMFLGNSQLDEARESYGLAIACDPKYAAAHFNLGNLNYRVGQFETAICDYQSAIDIRPDFAEAFLAMANAFDSLGHATQAAVNYGRALSINPNYSEAHLNLGLLASAQQRYDEAAASLFRAVQIRPDLAQAHQALGTILIKLGQLDKAESSLRRAFSIEPESSGILYDLAMLLLLRGKAGEALPFIAPAALSSTEWSTKVAFVACVARSRFTMNDSRIRAALTSAIAEPWGIPYELSRPALSLVMLDPVIAGCVRRANMSWPIRLSKAALFAGGGMAATAADPLLHALLVSAPVTTTEVERFLTCARSTLLEIASSHEAPGQVGMVVLKFYAALSQQCFINEYIFDCDSTELQAAASCRAKLLALLDANDAVPAFLLLAVAAYFPLNALPDASRLLIADRPDSLDGVLRQQICEPLEEQRLRAGIECLTSVSSGVSEEVRDQYETNPYPRWVKLPIRSQIHPFNRGLRLRLPSAPFTPLPDDSAPEVLIAGCGTGAQSILFAQRFLGTRVLAIDLSLSSISYAKRKTHELGVTNVEYAQADILKLGSLGRTFDIIESIGVLHHLSDPFEGWRTLLSLLRPGGFMSLGFYSELARRHVVKARERIAARGYASSPDDIRRFRQDFAMNSSDELTWLSQVSDFYSTSECRDLLFHVQEHRLTLAQIESFLAKYGLHFVGFQLDINVTHQYRARFADDPSGTNLRNWARFEADNPDTFAGMYRFWIQKPSGIP